MNVCLRLSVLMRECGVIFSRLEADELRMFDQGACEVDVSTMTQLVECQGVGGRKNWTGEERKRRK